jgi:hypothetical protein
VYGVNMTPEGLPEFVEATWGSQWALAVGLPTQSEVAPEAEVSTEPARVFDSGTHLIVSGPSQLSVVAVLEELTQQGAKVVSQAQKVGNKWIASCDPPPSAGAGCRVEEIGLMRIVTGPSREAVTAKVQELLDTGARLVHDVDEAQGVYTAVCEVSAH